MLNILKSSGARVGVVYHDVEPYSSARLVDKLRRIAQTRVMRHALKLADLAVFTVPLYKLSWLPFVPTNALYTDPYAPSNRKISTDSYERHVLKMSKQAFERFEARNKVADNPSPTLQRCHFIPVGPNLPIAEVATPRKHPSEVPTVGVFSITGGEQGTRETETIVMAAKSVCKKLGRIRLLVFGRHAEIREASLRRGLQNTEVELSVEGLLAPTEIVARIRSCDILFFVRGGISTRRSSAIAGIACGVPMVAFVGPETSWPFPDAGVVLVSPDHPKELIDAANLLLTNTEFREGMALANCIVYQEHFSWVTIAHRYAAVLSKA
ncbi:MAG TPA: hypothetical protein VL128_15450 [Candidatus Eisenbacteria bacterium]|nr:hypothetical protein [Candidatus Eisenbacteria bacterium]